MNYLEEQSYLLQMSSHITENLLHIVFYKSLFHCKFKKLWKIKKLTNYIKSNLDYSLQ